jgi:predicted regulator of amino acid metabolism with ACT domain
MQNNTNMSTRREEVVKYRNVAHTFKTIWKEEGFTGFFQGIKMRMMIQSVSSGVAWGTYQIIKNQLVRL